MSLEDRFALTQSYSAYSFPTRSYPPMQEFFHRIVQRMKSMEGMEAHRQTFPNSYDLSRKVVT